MVIKSQPERLYSLDALRGFDMFWIMGGEYIFKGLATLTGWPLLLWWAEQLDHVEWHGFRFYDMIFPLFLFIAGISFPYSLASRTARQESRASLYRHVISRGFILVLLGILYNNAVSFDLAHLRYGSVLGRIGLAWMFAALIAMNTGIRTRIAWFWGLLVGYWLLLYFFPIHHFGAADIFSRQGNLASYLDRLLLPGRLHIGDHDPEGILSTMPAISTALLGMFAGEFLRSTWRNLSLRQKGLAMILAGSGLAAIGQIWNLFFPINKNLWSSSFVCYAGGLSLILFSVFLPDHRRLELPPMVLLFCCHRGQSDHHLSDGKDRPVQVHRKLLLRMDPIPFSRSLDPLFKRPGNDRRGLGSSLSPL